MRRSIGLDLGSSAVKAVEIARDGRGATMTGLSCDIRRPGEDLGETVGRVLASARLSGRDVTVGVAGRSVMVRYLCMPGASESELRQAIPFEAERLLPFDLEAMRLDCQVLGPRRDGAGEATQEVNVLLAACRREEIDERLSLVRNRGLSPRFVDLDLFAVVNAWGCSRQSAGAQELANDGMGPGEEGAGDGQGADTPLEARVLALVDVGRERTTVSVVSAGTPCFSREIGMGGGDMTQAIARAFGLGTEEAESIKCDPGEREEDVRLAMGGVLEDLGNELSHSLDHVEHHESAGVEVVRVSGGGSLAPGVLSRLEEVLGRPVTAWNPAGGIAVAEGLARTAELDRWSPSLAVAMGLAWRGLER